MTHYTSLNLSKKLKENGCNLKSNKHYYEDKLHEFDRYNKLLGDLSDEYNAYDILWDICIKYVKEFFGEGSHFKREKISGIWETSVKDIFMAHPCKILEYLQQNRIQDAEDYIWSACLFNPKNKEE